jgi:CDP-diacylglycerol--glycerol-3-phosphate 3-phosphatidyltransferase
MKRMLDKEISTGPYLQIADDFLKYTVLRLIPQSVTPNAITTVRFICVPIVIFLLLSDNYVWGAVVFALAAFTDALDGAMARTRGQITRWGKVADPFADKLLISSTAVILVTRFVDLKVAVIIISIELLLIARAIYRHMTKKNAGANAMGKVKMVIQSVALVTLFLYAISGSPLYLMLATWGLLLAIFFAVASLFTAPAP